MMNAEISSQIEGILRKYSIPEDDIPEIMNKVIFTYYHQAGSDRLVNEGLKKMFHDAPIEKIKKIESLGKILKNLENLLNKKDNFFSTFRHDINKSLNENGSNINELRKVIKALHDVTDRDFTQKKKQLEKKKAFYSKSKEKTLFILILASCFIQYIDNHSEVARLIADIHDTLNIEVSETTILTQIRNFKNGKSPLGSILVDIK